MLHIPGDQGRSWGTDKTWVRSWRMDKDEIGAMETQGGSIMLIGRVKYM